ncbi:MAG: hypothetical protein NTY19_12465, partial [Planctomycetota bacterium]|nr:hypothetical protein [Planctomycetota bacterium]
EGKTGAAADLLCPLATRASLSPPMQVVRRRTVAVGIVARAINALRDDKGTTTAEAFTPTNAKSAVKYLGLVDVLARELEPNDKDWPDLEENRILVVGINGDQPQKVVDLVKKLRARNKKLSLPVLRQAAHAERKLLELSPESEREDVREHALNAYAELLRSSRDAHDEFLDEARVMANLQSLEEKLIKWKTEELLPQLRNPGDELKAMLPASRLREPIALIYGLHGRRLRNTYDDSPAGIRNRLHAFAIAAWLASQPAKYLVELGETVRLLAELNTSTRFDTLEGLAQDASKSDPSYHGAYGLQAYVQLEQSRQTTDVERHRHLLDKGIATFEQALQSQPPEADRAWYLVGLSTAYVERAILAGSEPGIVASCETTEVLKERRDYLTKARERAAEATTILDPINPPEDAWIAKGNSEEDLAYYVHEVDKYEQAHESFTTAVGKAEESRRASFTALLCRTRCRLRQIEDEPPAGLQQEVANLQQDVLKDLDVVTTTGTQAEQAEAYYWQGRAYSRLARQAEQEKAKESVQRYWGNADAALGKAVTIAQNAVPLDWAQYQWEWMNAAYDTRVWSDLKSRAKTLRDEAAKPGGLPVPAVIEYKAIVADFEADLRDRRTAALPAVRNGLDTALERFPQTDPPDPSRLSFRIRLLVQRCVWLITYSESLPDQALADATAAVSLADSLPATSTTQREELQGLARGTRAVYYDRKFIAFDRDPQNKDLDPEKKTKLKLELAIKAKEESGAALKHYAAFRRLCRTNPNQALAETVEYRWILGMGNRDLHKLYPDKFSPQERANMAKDAQEALLPLRGKLPTNKNNDLESALKYFSQPATPSSK